jgi:hypothetical protein
MEVDLDLTPLPLTPDKLAAAVTAVLGNALGPRTKNDSPKRPCPPDNEAGPAIVAKKSKSKGPKVKPVPGPALGDRFNLEYNPTDSVQALAAVRELRTSLMDRIEVLTKELATDASGGLSKATQSWEALTKDGHQLFTDCAIARADNGGFPLNPTEDTSCTGLVSKFNTRFTRINAELKGITDSVLAHADAYALVFHGFTEAISCLQFTEEDINDLLTEDDQPVNSYDQPIVARDHMIALVDKAAANKAARLKKKAKQANPESSSDCSRTHVDSEE